VSDISLPSETWPLKSNMKIGVRLCVWRKCWYRWFAAAWVSPFDDYKGQTKMVSTRWA